MDEANLQREVDDLRRRLEDVRTVKHQISNELMAALGHAQLLDGQADLSAAARQRLTRIRNHCRNIGDQAEELTRICTVD